MTPFHVGMRVVCVDDEHGKYMAPNARYSDNGLDGLTSGEIYTIREICVTTDYYQPDLSSCRLVEIVRPLEPRGVEPTYALARFRPAHENRMDELRTLLAPVPSKAKELVQL
jgi:hypothetical protein